MECQFALTLVTFVMESRDHVDAVGSLNFGLDGSLLVTTGEGAHWNFDMGDWGQDALLRFDAQGQPIPSLDNECLARFGAEQGFDRIEIDLISKILELSDLKFFTLLMEKFFVLPLILEMESAMDLLQVLDIQLKIHSATLPQELPFNQNSGQLV